MTANAQTDVTSTYLTNAGFDNCTAETSDVAAKGIKDYSSAGWTKTSSGDFTTIAVTAYGSNVKVGSSTTPATKNDGTTVAGNTLGIIAGWGDLATLQSGEITLPAGAYTLTIDHYLTSSTSNYDNSSSRFGFVTASNSYLVSSTTFTASTWTTETVTFSLTEETTGKIQVGLKGLNKSGSGSPAVFYDDVTITYTDPLEAAKADWTAARAAAVAALDNAEYDNVTGDERTALANAIETYAEQPNEQSELEAQTAAFNSAVSAFTVAKTSYDALAEINAVAKAVGIETAGATTAALAATASQTQNVAVYNQVKSEAYNYTVYLGDWTTTGATQQSKGQHWDGTTGSTYYEPNQWGSASVSWNMMQDKVLPAGTYVLMATGRRSGSLGMTMSVKNGDVAIGAVSSFPAQDTGKGVDTFGAANFGEGTFANTNGRGWEWRFIPFTLKEETTVTLDVTATSGTTHQWASICAFELRSVAEVNPYRLALMQSITDAKAIDVVTNVGTGVFQKPAAAVTKFQNAISAAETVRDNGSATNEDLQNATTDLTDAIAAFDAVELNAPAEGQLFNVVLTYAGWTYDGKAMTYIANGRNDAGLYNIQYKEAPNQNLAQAFTFTKVSGNNYKLSQIDADGNVRYISTGTPYNGNTSQIRTTTNSDEALAVTIIPTATEGVYNLKNTAANQYIGSQDAGVYTVNSHIDFQLVETSKPNIAVNTTEAGWGTLMLPFAMALPEGVKAYTCAAVEGETLTLDPVNALAANTPYIIEGSWNATLTGDAQGTALNYTVGLLTGVYTAYTTQGGEYVLQNHEGKVAFYQVGTDEGDAKPVVPANRAYLTYDPQAGARALFFPSNEATGISAISALVDGQAEIFNEGGQKLQSLQKGINILRTSDGRTVKLMVK